MDFQEEGCGPLLLALLLLATVAACALPGGVVESTILSSIP
jgi:hypothetical protein